MPGTMLLEMVKLTRQSSARDCIIVRFVPGCCAAPLRCAADSGSSWVPVLRCIAEEALRRARTRSCQALIVGGH